MYEAQADDTMRAGSCLLSGDVRGPPDAVASRRSVKSVQKTSPLGQNRLQSLRNLNYQRAVYPIDSIASACFCCVRNAGSRKARSGYSLTEVNYIQ